MPTRFPNYYELLSISPAANQDEIRQAYKRESLKTHPDRLPNATQEERKRATEKFQAVADAYYVLSDPTRKKEYDALYSSRAHSERTTEPDASSSFFANFASMFGGANASGDARAGHRAGSAEAQRPDPEGIFGDVFEELLRPEIERRVPWWSYIGTASGGALGFIIANFPGMLFGGYAGNRLGAIRDAKGKSVAAVFSQLGGSQKAEILRALALKVLGSAL